MMHFCRQTNVSSILPDNKLQVPLPKHTCFQVGRLSTVGAGLASSTPVVNLQSVKLRSNHGRRRQHRRRAAPLRWVTHAARHHMLRELRRQIPCGQRTQVSGMYGDLVAPPTSCPDLPLPRTCNKRFKLKAVSPTYEYVEDAQTRQAPKALAKLCTVTQVSPYMKGCSEVKFSLA